MTTGSYQPSLTTSETTSALRVWDNLFQSRRIYFFGYAFGLILLFNQILFSTGFVLDDEISHYWNSHNAWEMPELLLSTWSRPGRSLFHFPIAWAGLAATRVYTTVFLLFSVYLTYQLGKQLQLKELHWLPLLLLAQPWVVEIGSHVLTQTPFLFFWLAGVYWHHKQRFLPAGFCFGYLPLVRHEGLALTACYLVYCLWKKEWRGLVLLMVPILVVNLTAWSVRSPLPFTVYGNAKPNDIYGSGPLWHFVMPTFWAVGLPVMGLVLCGLKKSYRLLYAAPLLLTYPVYFVMHSVIFWKGLFASGGYVYFLMPMAPFFALLAVAGVEQLREWLETNLRGPVLALFCLGIIGTGWCLPSRAFCSPHANGFEDQLQWMLRGCPCRRDPIKNDLDKAIIWLSEHPEYSRKFLKADHPYLVMELDYPVSAEIWKYNRELLIAPEELLVIWDRMYMPIQRSLGKEDFLHAGWQELAQFGDGSVAIFSNKHLLEKR